MALVRKEKTTQYDHERSTKGKDPERTTISYQEERSSKSKMGPVSSTVEGTK